MECLRELYDAQGDHTGLMLEDECECDVDDRRPEILRGNFT